MDAHERKQEKNNGKKGASSFSSFFLHVGLATETLK